MTSARRPTGQSGRRPWRIWNLDAELRYRPVLAALPPADGRPLAEVGCGGEGIAAWTTESVLGIDPGEPPDRPGPSNLTRISGSGDSIPLPDETVRATVAVDTFEHIPPALRPAVAAEMVRVTAAGGCVAIIGPTGPAAARGDAHVLRDLERRGADPEGSLRWLREHAAHGLPEEPELRAWLALDRVGTVNVTQVLPIAVWRLMHLAASGRLPRTGPFHRVVWGPVAAAGRHVRVGPCYRSLIVASIV